MRQSKQGQKNGKRAGFALLKLGILREEKRT